MASYKLLFKKSVAKDLRSIPNSDVKKILKRIETLSNDPLPVNAEKLSGQQRYRIRQGNYRILYELNDMVLCVTVVKIGHRRDVYQSFRNN